MITAALSGRTIAVDIAAAALNLARDLGAEQVIAASNEAHPAATITEITDGGAQISIGELGSSTNRRELGVPPAAHRGHHLQVGLLPGQAMTAGSVVTDRADADDLAVFGQLDRSVDDRDIYGRW